MEPPTAAKLLPSHLVANLVSELQGIGKDMRREWYANGKGLVWEWYGGPPTTAKWLPSHLVANLVSEWYGNGKGMVWAWYGTTSKRQMAPLTPCPQFG